MISEKKSNMKTNKQMNHVHHYYFTAIQMNGYFHEIYQSKLMVTHTETIKQQQLQ